MYKLKDNERAYLQLAYDKGYRHIATDENGNSYFFVKNP